MYGVVQHPFDKEIRMGVNCQVRSTMNFDF